LGRCTSCITGSKDFDFTPEALAQSDRNLELFSSAPLLERLLIRSTQPQADTASRGPDCFKVYGKPTCI
jgi:hypothetical protein